jgi:ABC-type branched-subunit amino acid transport system permease subunit
MGAPLSSFNAVSYAGILFLLGGMCSLKGAAVGALIVGFIDNSARALFPELACFSLFFLWWSSFLFNPPGCSAESDYESASKGFQLWWAGLAAAVLMILVLPPLLPSYYVSLITLASAMCVWGLVDQWVNFTGGENGILGISPQIKEKRQKAEAVK